MALDTHNWGHKIPTQSKKRKDNRKEKVKGSWPWTHTVHSVTVVITNSEVTSPLKVSFLRFGFIHETSAVKQTQCLGCH